MTPDLFMDLYILILLWLLTKILSYWCVKDVFRFQCHTKPMLFHPPVSNEGLWEAQTIVTQLLAPVGRRDERIFPILYHVRRQTRGKGVHKCVDIAQHCRVDLPPHNPNTVGFSTETEQVRGPYGGHWYCDNLLFIESDLWAHNIDFCLISVILIE